MKVYELLYEGRKNIKEIVVKRMPNFKEENMVGSGAEAEVFKAGANSVIKVIDFYKEDNDPTVHYIDEVMNNQDNPYFPKIYGAKAYMLNKDKGQYFQGKLVIHMEKLTSFNNPKTSHMLPRLLKQFGISEDDFDSSMGDNNAYLHTKRETDVERTPSSENPDDEDGRYNMLDTFGKVLADTFATGKGRQKLMKQATNPELKRAIQITDQIINRLANDPERPASGDLHQSNIMIRLTPHGPQLVIVDPVIGFWQ